MLTIRKEQVKLLKDNRVNEFEKEVNSILYKNFTIRYNKLGKKRVSFIIKEGMEKAKQKKIISRKSVCKYIILIFIFGRNIENNSKFTWQYLINHKKVSDLDIHQAYQSAIADIKRKNNA